MNNIRTLRKQLRFSQEALAALAATSRNHLSLIEKGDREPGIRLAHRIAAALESPLESVFPAPTSEKKNSEVVVAS